MVAYLENPPKPDAPEKGRGWTVYMGEMQTLATDGEWDQLEALLLEDHPVLPGEKEAFIEMAEKLGRPLRVELDESGMHVVPIESIGDED